MYKNKVMSNMWNQYLCRKWIIILEWTMLKRLLHVYISSLFIHHFDPTSYSIFFHNSCIFMFNYWKKDNFFYWNSPHKQIDIYHALQSHTLTQFNFPSFSSHSITQSITLVGMTLPISKFIENNVTWD